MRPPCLSAIACVAFSAGLALAPASARAQSADVSQADCNAMVAAMTDMTMANAANLALGRAIMTRQVELFATLDEAASPATRQAVRNMAETIETFQAIDPETATAGLAALRSICPANFR
ncbi:hypothetical protein [Palleronia rufa]|uniref:hypothetical protein n=2 Tax=Palleronia rufa TaxID=1530186 RepID=UPI000560F3BF